MKNPIRLNIPAIFILMMTLLCGIISAKDYQLYLLAGQSNMDGFGYNSKLPAELKKRLNDVFIFHGNTAADTAEVDGRGIWEELRPGHGVGFSSDGTTNTLSERFGAELSFAVLLKKKDPLANIAIIKYSRGGTSIDPAGASIFGCWGPDFALGNGVNQYDHCLATIRNAFAVRDIDGDGQADRLIPAGIIWMQGESDAAYKVEIAHRYEKNLKHLMDLLRAALRVDDLPVAIGRISDSGLDPEDGIVWPHAKIVRAAQAAFCQKDPAAILVTGTDNYGYSDRWHYDSAGYIALGREFATAMLTFHQKKGR